MATDAYRICPRCKKPKATVKLRAIQKADAREYTQRDKALEVLKLKQIELCDECFAEVTESREE